MNKFKVCVIGCGVICESHLSALDKNDNTVIAAVCDIRPQRAEAKGNKYSCSFYTDYKEMIETEKPDAVHICLPHCLHRETAIFCLERGIRVLCEKPMNADLAGAEAMAEASERTATPLGIIFQNRYNSGSVMAKALIGSGRLGKVLCVSGQVMWKRDQSYYDQDIWRCTWKSSGGGVCVNQAIHTLDLMRWLAAEGSEPASVKATASHHGDTSVEVEDTAEGVVDFPNGVRMLFYFTINNVIDDSITVTVNCEKGKLCIEGGRCRAFFSDGSVEHDSGEQHGAAAGAKAVYGSSHQVQIAEFYSDDSAVRIRATMQEALKTQRLLHAVYLSAGIL